MSSVLPAGYSTDVRLSLHVDQQQLPLAKIGPNEIVMRTPQQLPPGPARIVMDVDGHLTTWEVELVNGAVPFDTSVEIRDL